MLVISLKSINQGFWSHVRCSWWNVTIFSCQIIFKGTLKEMIKNALISIFRFNFHRTRGSSLQAQAPFLKSTILFPRGHPPAHFSQHQEYNQDLYPESIFWTCTEYLYSQPVSFARFDVKSVNRRLPALDRPRGHNTWCWLKGAQPLGTRMQQRLVILPILF